MDLLTTVRVLRDRWMIVVLAALLATLAGGLVTWRQKPVYASTVMLYVSAATDVDSAAIAYQGGLLSQQRVKSYAELLRGQAVTQAVVDQLHLSMTPSQLAGRIDSSTMTGTALLSVTVQGETAEQAQQLANAVANQFVSIAPTFEATAEVSPGARKVPVQLTVVSPAALPSAPISPRPVRNMLIALTIGVSLGVGLTLLRHFLDTTIKSVEQAAELTRVPSLGSVAADPNRKRIRFIVEDGPHSVRSEGYRKIRTSLQFLDIDRAHKTVLVTSALPDEGKTSVACNLARTLAEAGKRVMLIDADLRKPSVAACLGLPNDVGLTSVLVGAASLAEATQSAGDLLSVLASGPIPPNPSELLGSWHMRELLDDLRASHDVIVIDSPPVLPVADATATAPACDGVLFVIRHGKTRRDQALSAITALRTINAKILGTVLNQVPTRGDRYHYDTYGEPARLISQRYRGIAETRIKANADRKARQ